MSLLCFHSIFNVDIFWSNRCLSVSHIMQVYGAHLKESIHTEVKIKCRPKYTLTKTRIERFVWKNEQYLYSLYLLLTAVELIWIRCPTEQSPTWRRKWSRAYVHHALFTLRFPKFHLSLNIFRYIEIVFHCNFPCI